MVSPEVLRRYPFFAGLHVDEIQVLAKHGQIVEADAGTVLFSENQKLGKFYLLVDGAVNIFLDTPKREIVHDVSRQLMREMDVEDTVVSVVRPGEVFGWSSLLDPFETTAGAKAATHCRFVEFKSSELLAAFEASSHFGYRLLQKVARVIHNRLHDRRVESLSHAAL